jgi:hypothetical protein
VGTRAALALGIGLLLAERMPASTRRAVALGLIGLGAVTTLPIVRQVLKERSTETEPPLFAQTEVYAEMEYEPPAL